MAVQKLHINGEWVSAAGGTLSAYNPATEEVIAEFGFGNAADVDAAVASAAAALRDPAWRDMAPAARARLLFQLADLMQEHTEEFAELETLNQGQPLAMSRGAVEGFQFGELLGVLQTGNPQPGPTAGDVAGRGRLGRRAP